MALDERSGAYFALGIAKAARRPVALLCTSGTAAANFLPAVVEASLSRVPIIVLTADRPRELREVGAAQTIDQVRLYGTHVKWFQDLPTPGAAGLERHAAQTAARAVHRAMTHPRGPVHVNFPLREPLLPEAGPKAPPLMGPLWPADVAASAEALKSALAWLQTSERPIVALGPEAPNLAPAVLERALHLGLPVLADPLCDNGRPASVLTAYDTFLRQTPNLPKPDLVIRLGATMTSKAFNQWAIPARLILFDWPGGFRDPDHHTTMVIEGDPALSLGSLLEMAQPFNSSFLDTLTVAQEQARARIETVLQSSPPDFEGHLYAQAESLWADTGMPILVASSMPVRDFDTFYDHGRLRIYGNRGAYGIDGLVSTALGIAYHYGDVLGVLGDLAFHHDLTGLIYGLQYDLNAFFVIVNNQGGAIFSFLPQSELDPAVFEELFGTPHRVDFSGVASLYGASFRRVQSYREFKEAFFELRAARGLRVLEWQTTARKQTACIHRRLYEPLQGDGRNGIG